MLHRDEPVLITAADRLHRVGYVVSCADDGAIVQPTAFEGSPLHYPAETRHSVLQRDVLRLRDLPSSREVGGVLFEQVGGGGVMAAELIARESDGKWTAHVGLCRDARVASGMRRSIDIADWKTPGEIAEAIESQRRAARGSSDA